MPFPNSIRLPRFYPFAYRNIALVTTLLVALAGCQDLPAPVEGQRRVEIILPEDVVGEVELATNEAVEAERIFLDVGIEIFEVEEDANRETALGDWIFDEIRQTEVQYLPYLLRDTLLESDLWGAVRVLPEQDPTVDVVVSGALISSDGMQLQLKVRASDSTGRLWFERVYADLTTAEDFPNPISFTTHAKEQDVEMVEPFLDIYEKIANDLLSFSQTLSAEQLVNIGRVSQMRYASDLAPESFAHHLQTDADGLFFVDSLAAENDPMIARMEDMRLRHHLFIDTIDEYYGNLHQAMRPVYDLWRQYSRDELLEVQRTQDDPGSAVSYGRAGDFRALSQRYDRYKWRKIYEQEFTELAAGFNYELAPALLELEQQVHGLTGTMSEQYTQWREILRQLFELENAEEVNRPAI